MLIMSDLPPASFEFYLQFAKPLVLNLSDPNDRIVAAAWVQKLRDPSVGSEELRTDYLKLLLFVLQRSRIIGPFCENPNNYDRLEEFPPNYKLRDVAKELLQADEADRKQRILKGLAGPCGDYPPFTIEYSSNLLEYCAAQDIPNFGVHAFYALSREPLSNWDNITNTIFPRGVQTPEEPPLDFNTLPPTEEGVSVLSTTAKSRSRSRPRSRASLGVTPVDPTTVGPDSSGDTPTKKSGKVTIVMESSDPETERIAPTWGSNLVNVSESPIYSPETGTCQVQTGDIELSEDDDSFLRHERDLGCQGTSQAPCSPGRQGQGLVPSIAGASRQAQSVIDEANRQYAQLSGSPQTSRRSSPARTPRRSPLEYDPQRTYSPREFGLSEDVQWQPAEQFFQGMTAPSPRSQRTPRELARQQYRTAQQVFPNVSPTNFDTDLENIQPDLIQENELSVSIEEAIVSEERVGVAQDIFSVMQQQQRVSPSGAGVPVTTPRSSPFPRRDLSGESPQLLPSPPSSGKKYDHFGLPCPIACGELINRAATMPSPGDSCVCSPAASPRRSPRAEPPITTILSPRPVSPDICSPVCTPPRRSPIKPWSPELSPVKLPDVKVGRYRPDVSNYPATQFTPPRRPDPPTPPSPIPYAEVCTPERLGLGDLRATTPPLRSILEAHEIPENFRDPARPAMRRFVHAGRRQIPVNRADRVEFSPLPTIEERAQPQIAPYRRRQATPSPARPLTDSEQFFISEFRNPKQRELLTRVMHMVADVEEVPLPPPHYEPLNLQGATSPDFISATSPPRMLDHMLPDEVVRRTADAQYASLASPRSSPRTPPFIRQPSPRTSPCLQQPSPRSMDSDLADFEAIEAAMLQEQIANEQAIVSARAALSRPVSPPSVGAPPCRRSVTPRTPPIPTCAESGLFDETPPMMQSPPPRSPSPCTPSRSPRRTPSTQRLIRKTKTKRFIQNAEDAARFPVRKLDFPQDVMSPTAISPVSRYERRRPMRGRRLDFTMPGSPPGSPVRRSPQGPCGLMDTPIPLGVPAPMRPPLAVHGWQTPPHLRTGPTAGPRPPSPEVRPFTRSRSRSPAELPVATPSAQYAVAAEQYASLLSPTPRQVCPAVGPSPRTPTGTTPPRGWADICEELSDYDESVLLPPSPRGITPPSSWAAAMENIGQETPPSGFLPTSPEPEFRSPVCPATRFRPAVFPNLPPRSPDQPREYLPGPISYGSPRRTPLPCSGGESPTRAPITRAQRSELVRQHRGRRLMFDAQSPSPRRSPLEQGIADIQISPCSPRAPLVPFVPIEYTSPEVSPGLPFVSRRAPSLDDETLIYESPPRSPEFVSIDTGPTDSIYEEAEPEFLSPPCARPRSPPAPPASFEYRSPDEGSFRQQVEAHQRVPAPQYKRKRLLLKSQLRRQRLFPMEEVYEPQSPPEAELIHITPPDRQQLDTANVYARAADQYASLFEDTPSPVRPNVREAMERVSDVCPGYDYTMDRPILDVRPPERESASLPRGLLDRGLDFESPPMVVRGLPSTQNLSLLTAESPPSQIMEEMEEIVISPGPADMFDMTDGEMLDSFDSSCLLQSPPPDYGPEGLASPYLSYTPPPQYNPPPEFYQSPIRDYGPERLPSPMLGYTPPLTSPMQNERFRQQIQQHQYTPQHYRSRYSQGRRRSAELSTVRESRREPAYVRQQPSYLPFLPCSPEQPCPAPDMSDPMSRRLAREYTPQEMDQFRFLDE